MAKFIWFLVTLTSFGALLTFHSYREIPVSNEKFAEVERKRLAAEEAKRKKAEEEARRLAEQEAKGKASAQEPTVVLDTPELQNGHQIYFKRGKCVTCHGKKGEGKTSQKAPKLAAQHDWYIHSTLVKFKKRERINDKMAPYLRNLSDQDFRDVASYLSKLPPQ